MRVSLVAPPSAQLREAIAVSVDPLRRLRLGAVGKGDVGGEALQDTHLARAAPPRRIGAPEPARRRRTEARLDARGVGQELDAGCERGGLGSGGRGSVRPRSDGRRPIEVERGGASRRVADNVGEDGLPRGGGREAAADGIEQRRRRDEGGRPAAAERNAREQRHRRVGAGRQAKAGGVSDARENSADERGRRSTNDADLCMCAAWAGSMPRRRHDDTTTRRQSARCGVAGGGEGSAAGYSTYAEMLSGDARPLGVAQRCGRVDSGGRDKEAIAGRGRVERRRSRRSAVG